MPLVESLSSLFGHGRLYVFIYNNINYNTDTWVNMQTTADNNNKSSKQFTEPNTNQCNWMLCDRDWYDSEKTHLHLLLYGRVTQKNKCKSVWIKINSNGKAISIFKAKSTSIGYMKSEHIMTSQPATITQHENMLQKIIIHSW